MGQAEGSELAQLLGRTAGGDEQAFAAVYDATASRVFGLAMRIVCDRAQAEEVSQEVYLRVWRNAGRFEASRGPAMPWILIKAHAAAVDRVRSAQTRTDRERTYHRRDLPLHAGEPDMSDLAHASIEAGRVRAALGALTPVQREALELAYFSGSTHSEVAALTGVALGTAKSRIRDGLVRLRDILV